MRRTCRRAAITTLTGLLTLSLGLPALAQVTKGSHPVWTIDSGAAKGVLNDAFALSPGNAWAVGVRGGGKPGLQNQLIEHWNGQRWQVAAVPAVSRFSTRLLSVSGTSATDIWAVGDQQTSDNGPYPPEVTLIMHWNGAKWARVPSPDPGAFVNRLEVVKAFGRGDVWASGFFQNANGEVPTDMTVHWNGTRWSRVSTPDPAMQVAGGTSRTDVWFMGAMPWRFNGSRFTKVPGPVSHAIVAISPSDAWGVASDNGKPVLNHWNGSAWRTVTTLPSRDDLFGLAGLAADDVWAVGSVFLPSGNEATFTMRWNGTTWTTVSSPNPPHTSFALLGAAAAASPATVFAVGQASGTSGTATLAMRTING